MEGNGSPGVAGRATTWLPETFKGLCQDSVELSLAFLASLGGGWETACQSLLLIQQAFCGFTS